MEGKRNSDFILLLSTFILNKVLSPQVCLRLQALFSKLFEPSIVVSYRLKILDNALE